MFLSNRKVEFKKKAELYAITLCVSLIALFLLTGWKVWDQIRSGNSDFIIYYTAIQMLERGEGERLYDLQRQAEVQQEVLRTLGQGLKFEDELLPFNHPPFQLAWYYPLSRFPYLTAWWSWNGLSLLCYLLGMWFLSRHEKKLVAGIAPLLYLGGLAFLPVFVTFIQGQDSLSLFLWFALACSMFQRSRDFSAGLCLSLTLQKFQLLIPFLLLLGWKKRRLALAGFLLGAIVLVLVSLTICGLTGLRSYLGLIGDMAWWTDRFGIYPSKMHCLRGQWFLLFSQTQPWLAVAGTVATSALFLTILLKAWKGPWDSTQPRFPLQLALLFQVALLVSPHLNFHDLSLALVPFVLIILWYQGDASSEPGGRRLRTAVLVFALPVAMLSLVTSGRIPIHLSVAGLSGLALLTFHQIQREAKL